MKQTLQLKLSQHLTLTPQLQQSIRLLQLSTLELNSEIERFLQDNPLLEREEGSEEEAAPQPVSMINTAAEAPAATATTTTSSTTTSSGIKGKSGTIGSAVSAVSATTTVWAPAIGSSGSASASGIGASATSCVSTIKG